MKANYSSYNLTDSINRIDNILYSSDNEYNEHKDIPSEEKLTFKNGYYVDITVLFIDMRGSKELAKKHTRPVLAKIYRSYISEVIAILRDNMKINDIYIEGDGIWAVFNTTTIRDVQNVFSTAGKISSLVDIINIKLLKKGYSKIQVGMGIEDGTSLYMKAGYSGSGINEVVWIGKVVGETARLCNIGNRTTNDRRVMLTENIYVNLSEHQKSLCLWNSNRACYHSNVINRAMDKWVQSNRS